MRNFALFLIVLSTAARAGEPAAPADRESFSFVLFGDRTGGRPDGLQVLERAIDAANRLNPDFAMTVGDLVQGYNAGDKWLEQMREYKAVMGRLERPWYPVAGNHDVYGGRKNRKEGNVALYKKHFGPLWYSFDYKWAHFVVLFSDEQLSFSNPAKTQNVGPEQLAWLEKEGARGLRGTPARLPRRRRARRRPLLHHRRHRWQCDRPQDSRCPAPHLLREAHP
ncbi:MAG: metallophosphoesterase family protein [Planctomycetota bacterium]|jgi:hypothetical protein